MVDALDQNLSSPLVIWIQIHLCFVFQAQGENRSNKADKRLYVMGVEKNANR